MKKLALLILWLFLIQNSVFAEVSVYSHNGEFGLRDGKNVIVEAKYKKLVRLGETAWIMQDGNKFGIIRDDGTIIIKPKYNQAERVLGKYVKFNKGEKYGIFDEMGFAILPVEYSSIDLLYGGMFVTCKNYKFGISDFNGMVVVDNIFDDIYMPDFNTLIMVYQGQTYEVKRADGALLEVPFDIQSLHDNSAIKITEIASNPIASTGYYSVTATNYALKLFSSISPAYEETIDELMFSKGADTVSILMKMSWLPKFPIVYAKKYYKNITAPNNGPLSSLKSKLKSNIKN